MNYNAELSSNNAELLEILNMINKLPDAAGGTENPNYTNQIPLSVNVDGSPYFGANGEDGYNVGYRINTSGGEEAENGMCCTGYIPYQDETIRLKNVVISKAKDTYFVTYDRNKVYIQVQALTAVLKDNGNGVYTGSLAHAGFIRITCDVIDDTSILTLDEPIS